MNNHRSNNVSSAASLAARRLAVTILSCALVATPVVHAQEVKTNSAMLNFVSADIESVIKAIGQYTNTTFIIDPRVKGTINLVSEKPLSKEQAMQLLTSTLRLQGYAVVNGDGFTKVVPEADAKLQAGPATLRGDQIATQIFRLNYESAANLVPVLRPLISPNNTINANPGNNTLVVTDYGDNLRRIGRIVAAMDNPDASELDVFPIKYAIASDIASLVNRLMDASGGAGATGAATNADGRVSLLADPRTNSVIIKAPSVARASLAKSLIAKLDQPTAQAGNIHVVYLKNAEATQLAKTLRAVMAPDSNSSSGSNTSSQQTQQQPAQTQNAQNGQTTSGGLSGSQDAAFAPLNNNNAQQALSSGGPGGFIQADPTTNTLIITASEPVYRNLREVIDRLDVRRAQIYIESMIVEVTADKAAEFGVQWAGATGNSDSRYRLGGVTGFTPQGGGDNLISQAASTLTNGVPLPPSNGLTLGLFRQTGGKLGLGAIAHLLESDANSNILSMPNLITLDNEEARIIVGQNVPFITGQFTTQASGGTAGVNPFQTIERQDIGLSLRVRPQVSEGGTVKMQIYQETSSIQPTSGASDIITNKRSIETNVLVDDGQVVVLGGLIEDTVNDGEEKVPGLGNLPVLGNLFKYRTRKRSKTNLMVFLRPTVIRSNDQSLDVAGDRYEYMRAVQKVAQPASVPILPDITAPILPPLQDGRPVGGAVVRPIPPVSAAPNVSNASAVSPIAAPVVITTPVN